MRYARFAVVLVVPLCIVGLVACGGGGSSNNTTPPPPTLSSVTVAGSGATVTAGQTLQLSATGHYSDGSTKDLTSTATWASSDTSVATVSATGLVTGVKAGPATITAGSGGKNGTMGVTVNAAAVTLSSIALTATQTTIAMGGTQQIVATGTYSDGSTQDISHSVTWASSNTSVFDVDSNGVATAKSSSGTADITASSNGVTSSKLTLTATAVAEKGIMIVPSSVTLAKYQSMQPTVYLIYTDNTAEDVSASSTASVTDNTIVNQVGTHPGFLTGKAVGTSKLNVSYVGTSTTFNASANITVNGNVNGVSVAPKTATVHQNGEVLFSLTGTFDSGGSQSSMKYVDWTTNPAGHADFNGPFTDYAVGAAAGTTTVQGNLAGFGDTASLTVDNFKLQSLAITPSSPINMVRNVTVPLTVTGTYSDGTTTSTQVLHDVTWTSSDPTIATVNSAGVVFSKHIPAAASVTITAALPNGANQTVTVNVAPGVLDHLEIKSDNASPKVGDVVHFQALAHTTDGRTFDVTPIAIWQSSDFNLALVDASGTFTALKAGTVTLTVYYATPWTQAVTIGQ